MTRLDKATNDVVRLARKMAEDAKKERAKPKKWKGKMIIPLKEWEKKHEFIKHEWRNYFPDEFLSYGLHPAEGFPEIRKWQEEWWAEYIQLMESSKPPSYGKYHCKKCILNPESDLKTTTLRDAIVKTHTSCDGKPLEFPCKVVNVYKCPYKGTKDVNNVLIRGEMWWILNDAIKYNQRLVECKSNTYTINFEKNTVNFRYLFEYSHLHKIEEVFAKIKFSRVGITDHESLYEVITTREKMKIILQEYIDALLDGSEKNWHHRPKMIEYLKEDQDYFLDLFEKAKSAITFEDLKDIDGYTIQYWRDRQKWLKEREALFEKSSYPKSRKDIKISDICASCSEFANIHCVNCNAWLCLNHWRSHGVEIHNYGKPAN